MRNRGLVFAMESEEAAAMASAEDTVTTELVDDIETPAEESDALVGEIESAHDDMDTLEQVQDVMAESVESGEGLSPEAAEMAEIVTESIMRRMGIKNHRVMPALESFGSKGSRLSATELAMEGITDTMKRIWRAIKKAFKQVWEYIKESYKRYFDGITKLEALVKKAEEAYKNIPSTKPENDKLDLPTVLATFSIDGDFKEENVGTILKNHTTVTNGAKTFPAKVKEMLTSVETAVKSLNGHSSAVALQTTIKGFADNITGFISITGVSEEIQNYFGDGQNFTVKKTAPLANDRVIAFGYNNKLGDTNAPITDKDVLRIEMTYFNANTKETSSDDTEVKTLERSAMMSVITNSRELLKTTKTYNEEAKKVKDIDKRADNIFNTIERAGDKAYDKKGSATPDADKVANNTMKASAEAIRAVIKTANTLIVGLPKENLRVVRVGMDYVFASMAEYRS